MQTTPQPDNPIELFYSYSHKDERLRKRLESHLQGLKRQGLISVWHDRRIVAGADWRSEIDVRLETAAIILLLISSDYIESDYCYGVEMSKALERCKAGKAKVIPVLLRPCEWQSAPFGKLQALPANAQPVTEWKNRDKAFLNIAQGVRRAVEEVRARGVGAAVGAETLTPIYSDGAETEERGRWAIVISATVSEMDLDKVKAIEAHLRKLADDTELTVMRIERGSVVLILEGTRRGFERVSELFDSGQLEDLLGYRVENVWWGFDDTSQLLGQEFYLKLVESVANQHHVLGRHERHARAHPTGEGFAAMLAWIEPDRELAAEKYLSIHRHLSAWFSRIGFPDALELADETVNRVALIALHSDLPPTTRYDPTEYFFSVAHKIEAEHIHSRLFVTLDLASNVAVAGGDELEAAVLLKECMQKLSAEDRKILLSYYVGGGRQQQEESRRLTASRLNISPEALRSRVYRLKTKLLTRMRKTRARHVRRGGDKK